MLSLSDAVVLAPGVRLDEGALTDEVRSARFPVNETGALVVRRQGRSLRECSLELARRHGLDEQRAADDVLRFAHALNAALLANVRRGEGRVARARAWLWLAVRLAPAGSLPAATARRYPISTSSVPRAALDTARALAGRAALLGLTAAALIVPSRPGVSAVAMCVGVGGGLVVHESAHAIALVKIDAAVVTTGLRTFVVHPALGPRRRRLVAAAGPATAAVAGVLSVLTGVLVGAPELALAGCPAAAHALGLTVATSDGRVACGL